MPERRVRVTHESTGVYFDDYVTDATELDNCIAESLAKQTAEDGLPRSVGYWRSVEIMESLKTRRQGG